MERSIQILPLLLLLMACGHNPEQDKEADTTSSCPEVQHKGSMHAIKMKGDLSGKKKLGELTKEKATFGLGPLSGLQGEVLIWNGNPFISRIQDESTEVTQNAEASAAFLVWSKVDKWKRSSIKGFDSLHAMEERIAPKIQKLPCSTRSTPFLLKGKVDSLVWHIVNWDRNSEKEHSPQAHRRSGQHGTLKNENVRILGFWSTEQQGTFIHHSARTHLHFITKEGSLMGHVDGLSTEAGKMELLLPQKD